MARLLLVCLLVLGAQCLVSGKDGLGIGGTFWPAYEGHLLKSTKAQSKLFSLNLCLFLS